MPERNQCMSSALQHSIRSKVHERCRSVLQKATCLDWHAPGIWVEFTCSLPWCSTRRDLCDRHHNTAEQDFNITLKEQLNKMLWLKSYPSSLLFYCLYIWVLFTVNKQTVQNAHLFYHSLHWGGCHEASPDFQFYLIYTDTHAPVLEILSPIHNWELKHLVFQRIIGQHQANTSSSTTSPIPISRW